MEPIGHTSGDLNVDCAVRQFLPAHQLVSRRNETVNRRQRHLDALSRTLHPAHVLLHPEWTAAVVPDYLVNAVAELDRAVLDRNLGFGVLDELAVQIDQGL